MESTIATRCKKSARRNFTDILFYNGKQLTLVRRGMHLTNHTVEDLTTIQRYYSGQCMVMSDGTLVNSDKKYLKVSILLFE